MNKRINQIILLLKEEMGLLLSISFGVFLFILFFQPFTINRFDFNNRLLFVGGFGAIVFFIMAITRVSFHWIVNHYDNLFPSYLNSFIIWALPTVAFAFYLRFVGSVPLTFFIVFKMALLCMAPAVILRIHAIIKDTNAENIRLKKELKSMPEQLNLKEADELETTIEFISENHTEKLALQLSKVALIKSANNYVEIIYKQDEQFKRKLLRNTLKNLEQQLLPYTFFLRCHRMCIVNTFFVDGLNSNTNKQWISIQGLDEEIPVSRQYVLKLKEAL